MQKIKKGDLVKILVGKDNSKEGVVDKVMAKEGKVLVAGVNVVKRAFSGRKMGVNEGGIIDVVKPVNLSNVALICPNCKKVTRVGFIDQGKGKVRICKKCKKEIVK